MAKRRRTASPVSSSSSESSSGSEKKDLRTKFNKAKKNLKKLKKKLASLEERQRMRLLKRKERCSDLSLKEIMSSLAYIFSPVTDKSGNTLWDQLNPKLQQILRQLMDEVASRWAKKLHLPILNLGTVKVRDDKPIIPKPLIDSRPDPDTYRLRYLDLVVRLFPGQASGNKILDDFIQKLSDPAMELKDFQNLYFHKLLQSIEEIAAFPADVVSKLRILKTTVYQGTSAPWEIGYQSWVRGKYKTRRKVDLAVSCLNSSYVKRSFQHRAKNGKPYRNTIVDEADLVRNLTKHFDEIRRKVQPAAALHSLESKQVAEEVYSSFPHISSDLYDYCYECRVDLDFKKVRTLYMKEEA